ncbi:N-formylglutamate amidohydrolase [Ahrensia kielensis]
MHVSPDFIDMEAFEVCEPDFHNVPFVMNSPHSGRYYPKRFLEMSNLDIHAIRRSEDYFVDELFSDAVQIGIPMLKAHFPRAYLDVNREPYELDPRMFIDKLPPYTNRNSLRVAAGLGTIPRIVCEGLNIYKTRIGLDEAMMRVEQLYKPYHAELRALLSRTYGHFGHAVLIDCHSMPASVHLGAEGARPDFIIGDRFGTSAAQVLSEAAVDILRDMGYLVTSNKPYAGGFITEHYGRPARGLHALQIEINRSLYVNEKTMEKRPGFDALRDDLTRFMAQLSVLDGAQLSDFSIAAE